jgi:hypothetical protein
MHTLVSLVASLALPTLSGDDTNIFCTLALLAVGSVPFSLYLGNNFIYLIAGFSTLDEHQATRKE